MAGFQNNFEDHKRLSERRNKLTKEGYWKIFKSSEFIEASRILIKMFFTKEQLKIAKTISAQTKNTVLILGP
jgi:hypothetical protein